MPEEAGQNRERELTPEEIEALIGRAGEEGVSPSGAGERDEAAPGDVDDTSDTEIISGPQEAEDESSETKSPPDAHVDGGEGIPLSDLVEPEGGPELVSPEKLLDFLGDVPLDVTIELGRASLTIGELISLREGAVVELDKIAGEPVDILANGRLIARGEVVVVNDYFSVRVTEVVSAEEADR